MLRSFITSICGSLEAPEDENFFYLLKEALRESFTMEFGDYENLGISSVMLSRLPAIVIAVFIGFAIAAYATIFNRRVYGSFVRSMTNDGCTSPEEARTLSELGFMKNPAVRSAIKGGHIYKGVLRCPGQDEYNAEVERKRQDYYAAAALTSEKTAPFRADKYQFDFEKDKFYIPEDQMYAAETKFNKKGTGLLPAILITAACIVMMWVAMKLLPELLQLTDNFIGIMGGGEKIN